MNLQKDLNSQNIRSIARKFAEKEIQSQMKDFKSWGIVADWKNYYSTMGMNEINKK